MAQFSAFFRNNWGNLSYGPQGFVIGPMAVVLAYGLVRFLASQSVEKST